jgi:galactokinase
MKDLLILAGRFRQRYGKQPRIFYAPGRLNLIGEHTDYNDGFVLPMAIDRGTCVAIAARSDRILRVWSLNLKESAELRLDTLAPKHTANWLNYVEGVASALLESDVSLVGADIAIYSDVSIGGGLSSSAALEISLGLALATIAGAQLGKMDLALAGQKAEHTHVGTKCGIMDQFTATHALKDHAILLDCRSMEAKSIPLLLQEYQFVICDSRVRHALASSEYNQRRNDCERSVNLLDAVIPGIQSLRDVPLSELERCLSVLPEPMRSRSRHVISENARTLRAADALHSGRLHEIGKLLSASHKSLRDDFAVSCPELDILVESASAQPGVLGSRLTGGGFGGCTVNLVAQNRMELFCEIVAQDYRAKTGIMPEIFQALPSDSAREIRTSWSIEEQAAK